MIPGDQSTFTDQDFLDMLNEEIQYFAIPHLLQTHEEYLLSFEDRELVVGKNKYRIPERAVGNKLREVAYVDSSNNYYELSRISVEDLVEYTDNYVNNVSETFYVENNQIVLVDELPFSTGVLRMFYYMRPSKLVTDAEAATITSIDRTSGVISVSNFQDNFINLEEVDFVFHESPNRVIDINKTPTAANPVTNSVTFALTDIPDDLEVGDYINFANESIVPQLPTELHPVLAQRVAVAALEALGDQEGLSLAQNRLDKMERSTLDLIDNRVEGAQEKITNRHSPLKQTQLGSYGSGRRGKF
jgi:hypothetical protein